MNAELREVWARLGVSLRVTPDEMRTIVQGDSTEQGAVLANILAQGRVTVCGDSYIPGCVLEEYCEKYGENLDGYDTNLETGVLEGKALYAGADRQTVRAKSHRDRGDAR